MSIPHHFINENKSVLLVLNELVLVVELVSSIKFRSLFTQLGARYREPRVSCYSMKQGLDAHVCPSVPRGKRSLVSTLHTTDGSIAAHAAASASSPVCLQIWTEDKRSPFKAHH